MDVDGGTFCAVLFWRSPPGNSLALLGHFSVGQICYRVADCTAFLSGVFGRNRGAFQRKYRAIKKKQVGGYTNGFTQGDFGVGFGGGVFVGCGVR
jgi:hypothetical protein